MGTRLRPLTGSSRIVGNSYLGIISGLPVNRPELRLPEISRPAVFAECVGDFASI